MQASQMTWYVLPRPIYGFFDCDDLTPAGHATVIAFAFKGDTLLWLTTHGIPLRNFTALNFVE